MPQNEKSSKNRMRQKNMMADWTVFQSVPSVRDPLERYKVAESNRKRFEKDFQFLLAKGCNGQALETALRMAATIRVKVLPSSRRVKAVVEKMRALAKEMSELESSYFLIAQESEEINRESPSEAETFHDAIVLKKGNVVLLERFPHFVLPELLSRRVKMYDDWLRDAENRVPPRRELLVRVRRVCPALYVKWATHGHPFCGRVATLLRLAGIYDVSGPQLNSELLAFEANYQLATFEILRVLEKIHRHELTYRSD